MARRKVTAGLPLNIRAVDYNQMLENLTWVEKQRKLNSGAQGSPGLKVRNSSGGPVGQYEILQINDRLDQKYFEQRQILEGIEPSTTYKTYAVAQNPIQAGRIGLCRVTGETMLKVDVQSTSHKFAQVIRNNIARSSENTGQFRILEPVTAIGVQTLLCAFIFGPTSEPTPLDVRIGTVGTTLLPGFGTSCEVDEEEWDGSSWNSIGNPPVTVFDSGGQNCYLPGERIIFFLSDDTAQLECVGSFGLERYAICLEDMIPDRSYPSSEDWNATYDFELVSYDPDGSMSPSLGGPGTFQNVPNSLITVRDPLRTSLVWRDQVVPVSYSPEMRRWVVRYPVGTTQRGRVVDAGINDVGGPGDLNGITVALYNPWSPAGNAMMDWNHAGPHVRVKREFARSYLVDGDEVEIRRDPIARGAVNAGGNNQYASAWVISQNASSDVFSCTLQETLNSTPANRIYDIYNAQNRLIISNWSPRASDSYARIPDVDYDVGTTAMLQIRFSESGAISSENYIVISCNETPQRTDCP